jgi:predicted Fe-Mo cluster-binding NifX family protein
MSTSVDTGSPQQSPNSRKMKTRSIMLFKRKNKKVFGVSLEEGIKKSIINNGLPLVLTRCVDYLEREAIKQEGIYRRSGNQKTVEDLIKLYDNGRDPNLEEYDPFVVAGLLKRYFTLLPDPITSYELYDKFIAAQMQKNKLLRPKAMKLLIDQLPKCNQYVLYFIIQHLVNVAKHNAENKMGISNLAIVFGPTLFRSHDESPVRLLSDVAFLRGCVETFIRDYEIVFSSIIPNNERVPISYHGEKGIPEIAREQHPKEERSNREELIKKRRGVSMSNMDNLREERSHMRFLLDKIAIDTEREEMEQGIKRADVKRDLQSNKNRFDELDQLLQLQSRLQEEELAKSLEEAAPLSLTSPPAPIEQPSLTPPSHMTEEEFQKSLDRIKVDLQNPLLGITERFRQKMQRAGLECFRNIEELSLQQITEEKVILKKELRFFDEAYKAQNGNLPDKDQKEPLRSLYNRYKELRTAIMQHEKNMKAKAENAEAPSVATDENYISPSSPLYALKNENINKVPENQPPSPGRTRTTSHRMSSSDPLYATMPMRDSKNFVTKPLSGSVENAEAAGLTNNPEALRLLLEDTTFVELRYEKKQLQKQLHQFQTEFQRQYGKKVTTKKDRAPMEAEYKRYKEVKAKIKQMVAEAEAQCSS